MTHSGTVEMQMLCVDGLDLQPLVSVDHLRVELRLKEVYDPYELAIIACFCTAQCHNNCGFAALQPRYAGSSQAPDNISIYILTVTFKIHVHPCNILAEI